MRRRTWRTLTLALAAAAALSAAPAAAADEGEPRDVRVRGKCTGSNQSTLRLRADDGRIRVEFELDSNRRGTPWKLIVLHERRIAFRGTLRTRNSGSLELRATFADWFGTDVVLVRATGLRGETCRASATI